jgi:hypothetical protein
VRFLIDADLPRLAKALLKKYGHEAIDVRAGADARRVTQNRDGTSFVSTSQISRTR